MPALSSGHYLRNGLRRSVKAPKWSARALTRFALTLSRSRSRGVKPSHSLEPAVDAGGHVHEIDNRALRAAFDRTIKHLRFVEDVRHIEAKADGRTKLITDADIRRLESFPEKA